MLDKRRPKEYNIRRCEQCGLLDFVENIRKRLLVNKSMCLKLSYTSLFSKTPRSKYILDGIDVKCYLLDCYLASQRRSMLHIILIEKKECDEDERNKRCEKF